MPYILRFKKAALAELKALSPGQKKAVADRLDRLESDAKPADAVPLDESELIWRIKAGARKSEIRIIYLAPDARDEISILAFCLDHSAYADLNALVQRR